jgi:peptidoglycan hydrolase FlgJ
MITATASLQTAATKPSPTPAGGSAVGRRLMHEAANQKTAGAGSAEQSKLREKFDSFVGESFYGQMLSAMHKTVGKAAYFNGGRAEEMFQGQLDQILAEKMTQADGGSLSGSLFDLFNLQTTGGRK